MFNMYYLCETNNIYSDITVINSPILVGIHFKRITGCSNGLTTSCIRKSCDVVNNCRRFHCTAHFVPSMYRVLPKHKTVLDLTGFRPKPTA